MIRSAEDLQEENLSKVAPCLILMSFLAAVGLVGNLLVLIVFKIKYPRGNFKNFVLCLSAIDTVSCLITIPGEVYIQYKWFVLEIPWLCSLKSYFNDFTVYSSSVTLLLISVDRFLKTCKPFQKQFTPKLALTLNIASICAFSLVAMPRGMLWGKHTYNVTNGNATFLVSICEKADDFKDSDYPSIYTNGVYVSINIIMMATNVILYCIIGRKIVSVNKQMIIYRLSRKRRTRPKPSQDTAEISEHNRYHDNSTNSEGYTDADKFRVTSVNPNSSQVLHTVSGTSSLSDRSLLQVNSTNITKEQLLKALSKLSKSEVKKKKKKRQMNHSSRKTLIVFIMVLVYVITTTAYLSLLSVISNTQNILQKLTMTERMVYLVFLRLYFINSVINPFLYGIMDHRFSSFLKNSGRQIVGSVRVAASRSFRGRP
ncbi:hypothetical protein CHS0354_009277 [Potamilus streckersoni]|uniref:G-protein coupled receptors family 1 profile domain-containing protein n=1 Tax=Potamilus streckersoni TaxID=2493646 RepID=A0AAE0W7T6_9BIVA|nr:hypothetical protein CHS0354_009277 [Potamilus streckersoni]